MGLDQYAYTAAKAGQHDDYYEKGQLVEDQWVSDVAPTIELAYWRKHPNLQGWMERLWIERGRPGVDDPNDPNQMFNCVELELTWEDLARLEADIMSGAMSKLDTVGFFFGEHSDSYYRQSDLEFIKDARAQLFMGLRVFYNSSW